MRLTTKGEYAVRATIYVLHHSDKGPVQISEIAKNEGISKTYIEQLFNKLKKGGILKSTRGPAGGYVLNKKPEKITIGDIVRCVEGPVSLTICEENPGKKHNCKRASSCKSYPVWKKINGMIESALDSVKLGDLI